MTSFILHTILDSQAFDSSSTHGSNEQKSQTTHHRQAERASWTSKVEGVPISFPGSRFSSAIVRHGHRFVLHPSLRTPLETIRRTPKMPARR